MDISGVNEDWEHQVTPLLHDMTNCDDDYFNPHELLAGSVTGGTGGNIGQTASGAQNGGSVVAVNSTTAISAQSPISGGGNPPSLSPGGVSASGVPTGALSPGSISQTSQNAPPTSTTSSCCENGRPIMTDPVSGQTVCSCQYDSARLALSSYSRIPSAGVGVYGTPYPSTEQNPYPSIGVDSSAFYSPLSNPYALKDSGPTSDMSAWTSAGLQPTTGYYPYDPTLAAYGYGAGYDLAARRKNATRESTATLKAWLNDHKKNPYPTKGEKIMLAIITKMTLTQVSTWFANARRRLKKENKMTWEPKNKTDDDDDAMVSDDDKDKDDMDHHHHHMDKTRDHKDSLHHVKSEHDKDEEDDDLTDDDRKPDGMVGQHHLHAGIPNHLQQYHPAYSHHHHHPAMLGGYGHPHGHHHSGLIKEEMNLLSGSKNQSSSDCGIPIPATKPKIWSLADTAACKTPPPTHHGAWMTGGGGGNGSGPGGGNYQPPHHNPSTGHHHQSTGMIGMMMSGGNGSSGATTPTNHMNTTSMMNTNPHHQHQSMTPTGMTTTGNTPMMNPHHQFTNSPYARYGGFLTGPHHYQTSQTQNAVTGPIHQQQQHQQQQSQQHQQHPGSTTTPTLSQQTGGALQQSNQQTNPNTNNNQSMGFPEVQTDTPPQTPPNMKLPSVAGNLISTATPNQINSINNNNHNNNTAGTPPNPTTGTCYNNNNNSTTNNNNLNQTNGYGSSSSSPVSAIQTNATYLGNFTTTTTNSPQKLAQEYLMSTGIVNHHNQNSHLQDGSTAFKPFYKSPQQITNGFVSPV